MKRSAVLGWSVLASIGCAFAMMGEREAAACGGCFHPPTQVASDITDERMLLAVSPTQTTLYDQIRYTGDPASFAWVLPIHGTVDVGLSADVLFGSVDTLTATQINPPPSSCPGLPASCQSFSANSVGASAPQGEDASAPDSGVTVTKEQSVGPYETVQLHATDSSALENWLTTNGFSIPPEVAPIINQYVTEGFDFLAMKLLPSAGVKAMRPVRVTSSGASLSLPLRMAAIGTGVSVGITLWVVSDGRYEPQNFPFYHIEDKDLVWDWTASASNYTTLRAQNETNLGGKGWELESSLTLNQSLITNVINSGGVYYGGGGYSQAPVADANDDYLPVDGADGGAPAQTAEQVRTADVAALFAGMAVPNVRVTRMRSDISHAAMTTDFVLTASKDQSELTNVRTLTQSVNEVCAIYNGCSYVGTGTPEQAAAAQNGAPESFSCTTTARRAIDATPDRRVGGIAIASAGAIGLAVMRIRRRRQRKSEG